MFIFLLEESCLKQIQQAAINYCMQENILIKELENQTKSYYFKINSSNEHKISETLTILNIYSN